MGYESRLYIVNECNTSNYAQVIAVFNCAKMGYSNGWRELFNSPLESEMYAEDGNTLIEKDKYGERVKSADFPTVIEWLEKEVLTNEQRRLKPLLALLKGFDLSQWAEGEMRIVHFGY